ncbi:LysR family transcriptional regulator [Microlunatus soli]|uniref:DNA-binding transcriptional regulator, LysR family n=1 Tax=Microlunatus soli TaxID=630515 RepID=A0A1H1W5A6_9ACTN|nr:LysR family transcriptional regulator [Microlunatus soli]SDS92224.1 DNA-binding transcriptional regulator, LysR family [Microlunatus soli]
MDFDAVRTFVVAADVGQFQLAAAELSLSQQAVSKRIAALERRLGVRLFTRTPRGIELTVDGRAFLPHAREVVRVAGVAAAAVRADTRPFRIDVPNRRVLPGRLVRDFHRSHPEVSLDVVELPDVTAAIAAIAAGTLDVSLRAVPLPARRLPRGVTATRVLDEQVTALIGPRHRLAAEAAVRPTQLADYPIWMPGNVDGGEWTIYYEEFAAMFGLRIDRLDPTHGAEPLLEAVAESSTLVTVIGDVGNLLWPPAYDLRCLRLVRPVPIYPHSLIVRRDNRHPAVDLLRTQGFPARRQPLEGSWEPSWSIIGRP